MQQMHAEPEEETAHPNRVPQSMSTMGSLGMPGMMMNDMDLTMPSLGMNGMETMGGMMDTSLLVESSEAVPSAVSAVIDSSSSVPDSTHPHSQSQDLSSAPGEPSQSQQPYPSSSARGARGYEGMSMNELADLSIASSFPGLSRPLQHHEKELLSHLDRLKFFLATAPSRWSSDGSVTGMFIFIFILSLLI